MYGFRIAAFKDILIALLNVLPIIGLTKYLESTVLLFLYETE